MVRSRRPVRGGKIKFDKRHEQREKPRQKQEKFNLRTAWYIKERQLKTAEVEERRKNLEEKKRKIQLVEDECESSEDEIKNPVEELLSTFGTIPKRNAIDTDSEVEEENMDEEEDDAGENDNESDIEVHTGDSNRQDIQTGDDETDNEEEVTISAAEEDVEDAETAREDAGHVEDPFSIHLRHDLDINLYNTVSTLPVNYKVHKLNWATLGNVICQIPENKSSSEREEPITKKQKLSVVDEKQYAKVGDVPQVIRKIDWNKLHVKSQIHGNISYANYDNIKDNLSLKDNSLTDLQKELFCIINNYQDLLYSEETFSNHNEIRFIYCLHAVNHVLKTRTKILHHNAKLQKLKEGLVPNEYRDQGLVRPKVLILVPFKHSCLKIVELLIAILIGEEKGGSVIKKKKFLEDFCSKELIMPKKKPKPEDYEKVFQGDTSDAFRIGISFTKKTLKLYTNFYSSDIIISSPLGLREIIGAEGEESRDFDFLASIELLIMDQTDLFLMQNWDHVIHILHHLHLQPKSIHDTDFSRVRSWSANGWSKYYRQTLLFSSIQCPEIYGIFNKQCYNYAGKVKVVNPISSGSVSQVVVQLPLVFQRVNIINNHLQVMDAKLEFFVSKILPHYKDSIMYHTLIYIPSYFDYVVLRNYFRKEELNFAQICEYIKDSKVAKARDKFYHSDAHFLLYSERAHFFYRRQIKGIRHIIFYAPPTFPHFFSEMCNLMQEAYQNPQAGSDSNMTITTIYSKYDILQMSAIVGTDRANKMLKAEKNVHMLMTKG